MNKLYKSSITVLIRYFIIVLFYTILVLFFVLGGGGVLLLGIKKEIILSLPVLISAGVVAIIIAVFLSFIRKNITVEVTESGVYFYRGKGRYLALTKEKFFYTSYVQRTISNVGVFTSRYLRVIDKQTKKWKDYRLYFSKKRFDAIMAVITSLNDEVEEDETEVSAK